MRSQSQPMVATPIVAR